MMNAAIAHRMVPGAIAILGLVAFWEVTTRLTGYGDTGSPTAIIAAIWRERSLLVEHGSASMTLAVAGLAVAVVFAFVVASAFSVSRRFHQATIGFVLASQTVPLVAIAPLVAVVIGSGAFANVVIVAWLCWFPAVVSFTQGLFNVSAGPFAVLRVAGATRWQIYRHLRLPGAANSLVAGVRASAGFGLIGAIVAEYGGSQTGLGALIMGHVLGTRVLSMDALLGLVVVCSVMGALLTWAAYALARYALRNWLSVPADGSRT